jgi:ubiquinone/menaquinone biosynthesis C-methylase UbiE
MAMDHNKAAAKSWNQGGADYDRISYAFSDALGHAAQRLWARPGERVLDIATGTGWTARNVARSGAQVVAIDIAKDLLGAARALSTVAAPPIDFQNADAEALPFADASFDAVISTFGIMFAGNQQQAAAEAARVCRSGGRLVITAWSPDPGGYVARLLAMMGRHSPQPAPAVSPLEWGDRNKVRALLGSDFDLSFETGVSHSYCPSGAQAWDEYWKGFGPVHLLLSSLDDARRTALRQDFIDLHEAYRTPAGITIERSYLLTLGTRR